jgi:sporulation protein YlmC with PRC-barrel domain
MNVIRLQEHEYPAPPQRDLRGKTVLDPSGRYLGWVANLYVDEDERQLRFVDVLTGGFLGLGRTHHLVPIEALIPSEQALRLGLYGAVELQVNRETVERSPTFPNPLVGPDPELQEAIRDHYGYS